ncbi:MAG: transglycosylase domain-containing protein [Solobacterium sp.]|nr:transglycosylase domain-containing protein [Solobacterium sp.]
MRENEKNPVENEIDPVGTDKDSGNTKTLSIPELNDRKNDNGDTVSFKAVSDGREYSPRHSAGHIPGKKAEADNGQTQVIKKISEPGEPTKVYTVLHEPPQVTLEKEKNRKQERRRRKRWIFLSVLMVIMLLAEAAVGLGGLYIAKNMAEDSPELNLTDFIGEESTKIYDDSGSLITEVGVYLRENVTYDKCPESLVDAFLSIEDSRFFTHFGFDIPRFTKAALENLKNGNFGQGGSTFTMQLVKNTYFSIDSMDASNTGKERAKTIEYKVQQIWLSIKLESLLNKKEIFVLYLNKLNFGGNIRGVQRAAQYYFGKNCTDLTLDESVMLAGIVNLPNKYNPYNYLDYATTRRNEVLYQMHNHGYLTDHEYALAKSVKVEDLLVGDNRQMSDDSQYQSYLDVVLEEVQTLTGADPTVKGMKIYTYLNRTIQERIEAVQNEETNVRYPDELMQVAMLVMDNSNGAVVGIGGGRNYDGARLLNRATMNFKQPGSSVKPILSYGLAFEYLGYSLDEILVDKPITYPGESLVKVNASGKYQGDVTIKDAVGNSLNIPAILTLERVVDAVGKETVVNYMRSIGFNRITNDNFHLSFAIGGTWFETTCLQLAGAHSMLINGGVYNEPHTISKVILTHDGTEYYPQNQNKKVLSSGSAYLSCVLMENNVTGPYFNYMQILRSSYPVYAKTGTTDWGTDGLQYGIPAGQMKDKWMISSTSNYTNAVWVGYDMAIKGKGTYYTAQKSAMNIPGNINRILLDVEEEVSGTPEPLNEPKDVEEITYVYGTYPHVRIEDWMEGGVGITSKVSSAGLEASPLVSSIEYAEALSDDPTTEGVAASYDQYGNIKITWATSAGICSGGSRNISLHDQWGNNIDEWGTCLVDLSWLVNDINCWATVYNNDSAVATVTSTNGYYNGWVGDLWGTVKVCGGYSTGSGDSATSCTVAGYAPVAEGGWWDENGNYHEPDTTDYSQFGYWDDNGNWIGSGWWDENGYHY